MNLPPVVQRLIDAQNAMDSHAYADCFAETALVQDEGRTHAGRAEIRAWIAQANQEYNAVMQPLDYAGSEAEAVLTAEVAGSFPGSPIVLEYRMALANGLINSLQIAARR